MGPLGVTLKQGYEKLWLVLSVPSTVATVLRCIWFKLLPVMSSIFIVFQTPVASGVQRIVQFPPSLKTEELLGSRGVGSAFARKGTTSRAASAETSMFDGEELEDS